MPPLLGCTFILCAILVDVFAASVSSAQAATLNVSQFQGDPAHTGAVGDSVTQLPTTPSWTLTAAAAGAVQFEQGVVSDGSNIYFSAVMPGVSGNLNNRAVFAANLTNGSLVWQYNHTSYESTASVPSVLGGMVYAQFGGYASSSAQTASSPYMVGVNAANGQQQFATSYGAQFGYPNQPTVIGNQVIAIAGYGGGLQAYNATTGATQWSWSTPYSVYTTNVIPAADAANAYIYMATATGSSLYAINRTTGAAAYSIADASSGGVTGGTPGSVVLGSKNDALVRGNTGFGDTPNYIVSFNLTNQTVNWRTFINTQNPIGTIAVANGLVYVPSGGTVFIYNEATGAFVGEMNGGSNADFTGNVLVTNNLLFASGVSATYAFDLSTMQEVWTTQDDGDLSWANGTLLISNSSSIEAFTLVASPVPEPATITLAVLGLGAMAATRLKRRRQGAEPR